MAQAVFRIVTQKAQVLHIAQQMHSAPMKKKQGKGRNEEMSHQARLGQQMTRGNPGRRQPIAEQQAVQPNLLTQRVEENQHVDQNQQRREHRTGTRNFRPVLPLAVSTELRKNPSAISAAKR